MTARDYIDIERLMRRCIVGTLPDERLHPQSLAADIRLWLDLTEAAVTGSLARTCNYGDLATQAAFILDAAHFRLLESAALCLVRLVLLPPAAGELRSSPEAARATLRKPLILPHPAVPAVTVERRRDELDFASGGPGIVEVFACPEVRITRQVRPVKPTGTAVLAMGARLWLVVDRTG